MRTRLTADDPACPESLHPLLLGARPPVLTVSRPLALAGSAGTAPRAVAIIGARKASAEAIDVTMKLAALVVAAGGVVLSGGALGVDKAAHEGALAAGGVTWCVAPCAPDDVTPDVHKQLFKDIEASAGGMLWTLPEGTPSSRAQFHIRNSVLVALADLVIVAQAGGGQSGSVSAARKALRLGRSVRVVRPAGWSDGFEGSRLLIRTTRVTPLESLHEMRALLGLPPLPEERDSEPDVDEGQAQLSFDLSEDQANLFQRMTQSPQHVDEIAHSAGIRPGQAATLLLTLALENVVVEGPSGFFRRQQLL